MTCPVCRCVFCPVCPDEPPSDDPVRSLYCGKTCGKKAQRQRHRKRERAKERAAYLDSKARKRRVAKLCKQQKKIQYRSPAAARKAARVIRSRSGPKLQDVYACGDHWHTTRQPPVTEDS